MRQRIDPVTAAKYLGISYHTLMLMVRNRTIPHVRVTAGKAGKVFFFQDTLDQYLDNLEKQSVAM